MKFISLLGITIIAALCPSDCFAGRERACSTLCGNYMDIDPDPRIYVDLDDLIGRQYPGPWRPTKPSPYDDWPYQPRDPPAIRDPNAPQPTWCAFAAASYGACQTIRNEPPYPPYVPPPPPPPRKPPQPRGPNTPWRDPWGGFGWRNRERK